MRQTCRGLDASALGGRPNQNNGAKFRPKARHHTCRPFSHGGYGLTTVTAVTEQFNPTGAFDH